MRGKTRLAIPRGKLQRTRIPERLPVSEFPFITPRPPFPRYPVICGPFCLGHAEGEKHNNERKQIFTTVSPPSSYAVMQTHCKRAIWSRRPRTPEIPRLSSRASCFVCFCSNPALNVSVRVQVSLRVRARTLSRWGKKQEKSNTGTRNLPSFIVRYFLSHSSRILNFWPPYMFRNIFSFFFLSGTHRSLSFPSFCFLL